MITHGDCTSFFQFFFSSFFQFTSAKKGFSLSKMSSNECEICIDELTTVRRPCNNQQCSGRLVCDECWEKCGHHCPICEASQANHMGDEQEDDEQEDEQPHIYVLLTCYDEETQFIPMPSLNQAWPGIGQDIHGAWAFCQQVIDQWSVQWTRFNAGLPNSCCPSAVGIMLTREVLPVGEPNYNAFEDNARVIRWFWRAESARDSNETPNVFGVPGTGNPIVVHTP
jgi:hypothetical protein